MKVMAIGVVEFSREGYIIRKVFAEESTYPNIWVYGNMGVKFLRKGYKCK